MKILRHGKYIKNPSKLRSSCQNCFCEIEIDLKEVVASSNREIGSYHWIKCPECPCAIYFDECQFK